MLWRVTRPQVRSGTRSGPRADGAEKKILVERAQAIEKEVWQKFNGSTANDYRQSGSISARLPTAGTDSQNAALSSST
jgi:hypothetical protein